MNTRSEISKQKPLTYKSTATTYIIAISTDSHWRPCILALSHSRPDTEDSRPQIEAIVGKQNVWSGHNQFSSQNLPYGKNGDDI